MQTETGETGGFEKRMNMEQIRAAAVLVLLALQSARDLRRREIVLWEVMAFLGCGAVLDLLQGWQGVKAFAPGLLPGAAFLALAWLSDGHVGYGDGILLSAVGVWLGPEETCGLVLTALLLCALLCGVLLMGRILGRKDTLPFVPFLLAAFVIRKALECL